MVRYLPRFIKLAAVLALSMEASAVDQHPAVSADALVDSIGINAHPGWNIDPWQNFTGWEALLENLGVRYVRVDGTVPGYSYALPRYAALNNHGIRFSFILDPTISNYTADQIYAWVSTPINSG